MARHLATTDRLGAPVYFCDSRSPWQRGSDENTNGLLRDHFPKDVTNQPLTAAPAGGENELNRRPGMVLQDRRPADLLPVVDKPSVADIAARGLTDRDHGRTR
jgi:transposase, IS30 family